MREETLPTPHGFSQDGKSNGPSGNELGFAVNQAHREMLHTPSSQEPGVKADRLVTADGNPAKIGERAYDKETGRLAQVGLSQQLEMLSTPNAQDSREAPAAMRPSREATGRTTDYLNRQIAMIGTPLATTRKRSEKFAEGRTPNVEEAMYMLRTPQASDGEKGGPNQRDSSGHPHLSMQIAMLPTPTTQEIEHSNPDLTPSGRRMAANGNSHSLNLADTVQMLPTPQARDHKQPDQPHHANFQRKVEKGYTIDLNSRIAMLPTLDANMGNRGEMKEWVPTRPSGHHACLTLNDAIRMKTGMLNTPSQIQHKGSGKNSTVRDRLDYDIEKTSDGQQTGMRLHSNFVEFLQMFPLNWTSLELPTQEWEGAPWQTDERITE